MRDVFVGGMCAAGVFLIFYRGDDRWERWLTNLAGFFAVGIALFPTTAPNISPTSSCGPVTPIMPQPAPHGSAIALVHAGCLIGLMAGIAFMALRWARQYTDSQKIAMVREDQEIERDPGLKMRNKRLYYGCVVAMAAAGALALIQEFAFSQQVKAQAPWLFYAEMVAFLAFGVAWFVKGRAIMGFRRSLRTARETLTGAIRRRPSKVSTGT